MAHQRTLVFRQADEQRSLSGEGFDNKNVDFFKQDCKRENRVDQICVRALYAQGGGYLVPLSTDPQGEDVQRFVAPPWMKP